MFDGVATPHDGVHSAYASALRLLGSRDHSVTELRRKLAQRDHHGEAIDAAIEQLILSNYVNDARYAELYAEQRMKQGYGPYSIRAKLQERGIDSHLVRHALSLLKVSWSEHAESVILRRFSTDVILDADQRATSRIARFLHQRGFSSSDALRALNLARRELNR